MENSWHQLKPRTGFLVRLADRLTDQSWQTLTQLYQPIVGPSAAGLYSALFWLPKRGEYQRHATLLGLLGMDLAHFYEARLRLEATGLLTTKVKTSGELTSFVYELQAPLAPADFFRDDLLSVQLLGVIGEEAYRTLVAVNTVKPETASDEQDITKNFLDVFHVDGQELNRLPAAITATREDLPNDDAAPALTPTSHEDFDFKLLGEILEHSFIDTKALRSYRQLLLTEHATYNLDEVTMARYVGDATDLATNQFDPEQFKRVIAQDFSRQHRGQPAATSPTTTQPTGERLSSAEQTLITVASKSVPALFLQGIKQKNGGFVTDGEQRIVRDLVSRQLFPDAVLNLMIYHVLVDEERPTLNKNLMDTIANDWSKSKVTTPQLAIKKIRERQQAAQQPRQSRRRQSTVKETLPDWAKKPAAKPSATQAKLSEQQQKQLQARIAKLQAHSNDGKEA
ncbi:replication initiation and membrane attachment family protein [Levilactobacillus suantsaiihabitans]|uniref:Replication initiation/membrane attachment protein n=1 Tax=Levilactobacillus suantsaiihabitans TaxID=2487722 RepID=A0A4Z0J9W2_9LACO|nr:DnaD domain protein [Levilactobacillus suantsaiihabitans]TGD18853.1 replication initiation/membrane attachment protein [Levilactobacillus suantsaiihabitans]